MPRLPARRRALRDGSYRGTLTTSETNEDELTQLMIGRSLDHSRGTGSAELGDVVLEVERLSCGNLFREVSFSVRAGEVVGF